MKNNYNPYTVPENFFETAGNRVVAKLRRRRCAIRIGFAAVAIAVIIMVMPLFFNLPVKADRLQGREYVVNNLADMYEYDIFLQVNFNE